MKPRSDDSDISAAATNEPKHQTLLNFPESQPFATGKGQSYSAQEQIPHVGQINTHVHPANNGLTQVSPLHFSPFLCFIQCSGTGSK